MSCCWWVLNRGCSVRVICSGRMSFFHKEPPLFNKLISLLMPEKGREFRKGDSISIVFVPLEDYGIREVCKTLIGKIMKEEVINELNILLGVVEGVQKFLKQDGSTVALMLNDALFDQFWRLRDELEKGD